MSENNPILLLHRTDGKTLEVRADEILSVEEKSPIGGAQITLTRTDAQGLSVQVAVREPADAIVRQLAGTDSALKYQAA